MMTDILSPPSAAQDLPAVPRSQPKALLCCPKCKTEFPYRTGKTYCSAACAKAGTRNQSRTQRQAEYRSTAINHYERASWLSYDVTRLTHAKQRMALLAILEAASGPDAALRRILTDPKLLAAPRDSTIGKRYPDTACREALNIAKFLNNFCKQEWGTTIRDTILDNGLPAWRGFVEDREAFSQNIPPYIYEETSGDLRGTYERLDHKTFMAWVAQRRQEHAAKKGRGKVPADPKHPSVHI